MHHGGEAIAERSLPVDNARMLEETNAPVWLWLSVPIAILAIAAGITHCLRQHLRERDQQLGGTGAVTGVAESVCAEASGDPHSPQNFSVPSIGAPHEGHA